MTGGACNGGAWSRTSRGTMPPSSTSRSSSGPRWTFRTAADALARIACIACMPAHVKQSPTVDTGGRGKSEPTPEAATMPSLCLGSLSGPWWVPAVGQPDVQGGGVRLAIGRHRMHGT